MKKTLAALVVATLTAAPAFAQEIGIPACDTFFRDYEACVTARVPEAQRATLRQSLDQSRSNMRQMAGSPQARPQLEQMCQQQKAQMSQAMQAYGCTFN